MTLAHQIAQGLNFLHSEGIVHQDLHHGNILIDETGRPIITDFGQSRDVAQLSRGRYSRSYGQVGMLPYVPPERFLQQRYTKECDIYSLAMILWYISAGEPPFHDRYDDEDFDSILASDIIEGERPSISNAVPEDYRKLMTECWQDQPDKRASSSEVVAVLQRMIIAEQTGASYIGKNVPGLFESIITITQSAMFFVSYFYIRT